MNSKSVFALFFLISAWSFVHGQEAGDAADFPVRGFCIGAPKPDEVDRFVKFIHEELAPRSINTLILRVDFNYQYESHPELRDSIALSKKRRPENP